MKKTIVLLITILMLFGCSDNSRNEEIQAILKKDNFALTEKYMSPEVQLAVYAVGNETIYFVISLDDDKVDSITVFNLANDSDEIPYCVYGTTDECYGLYWDEENPDSDKKKKVLEQSKLTEKKFNEFIKKNKIKKQELIDFFQYYYDEHKDKWDSDD